MDKVLPEERLALTLPDLGYNKPLVVAPWRSLLLHKQLDTLQSIPKELCHSTILTFEWEDYILRKLLVEMGFQSLFCTSISKKWPIRNFSYPDYISEEITSNPDKDIQFSFVGWENNSLRKWIFKRFEGVPSVIKRDRYSYTVENRNKESYEYLDILSRSRFSLCPSGVGTGTKRFWESLKAGAIPILISNEWTPPPCWDWKNTIITLKEWEATQRNKIPVSMILPRGREEELRNNCYKAATAFSNPEFIANYLKNTI